MAKSAAIKKAVDKLDDALKVGHDVVEVAPNTTSPQNKKQIYQFAGGSKGEIAAQVSAFMAQYEYIESKLGTPDFEKFADNFEKGFPTILKSVNFGGAANPWGKKDDQRPKFKILNSEEVPTTRYVYCEFWPDRSNDEESYFLMGTPYQVIDQVWQIWNFKQIIEKADLVHYLGMLPSEALAKRPTQGISITFILYSHKTPPFRQSVIRPDFAKAEVSIPFVLRSSLKYAAIKEVFGGSNGISLGQVRCIAWLADKVENYPSNKWGMPQMSMRGTSYSDAKSNLKKLLQFTEGKVVQMRPSEPDPQEDLNPSNDSKKIQKFYLHHAYVMNSRLLSFATQKGREVRLGKLNTKKNKILFTSDTEPPFFNRQIDELFKWD